MRGRLALWTVEVATWSLPAGEIRRRYHREFAGELYGLSRSRQLGHALAILCTAPALRAAVHQGGLVPVGAAAISVKPARPLMCRLNLHHHWRRYSTEDGSNRYWACDRCGKDRRNNDGGPSTVAF